MLLGRSKKTVKEALQVGVAVDIQAFAWAIRRCSEKKALCEGIRIHRLLAKHRHDRQTFLGNLLVHMYGSCDRLEDARSVFENILTKNVFSWNIIIAVYAQNGHLQEALFLFQRMDCRNVVSWNTLVGFFAQSGSIQQAKLLYNRMPQWDVVSGNVMIAAFAQNGDSHEARNLFLFLPERNIISWNALITAFSEGNNISEAQTAFERMPSWNSISWSAIITANAQNGHLQEARFFFEKLPVPDVISCTAMIIAYGEQGEIYSAKEIFDRIDTQDTLSWSMMISAYAQNGYTHESVNLFRLMDLEGVPPDSITFVNVLEAYGNLSSHTQSRLIHRVVGESGKELHPVVSTALMNMYGKCGNVVAGRGIFDKLPHRDVVTWNTMMVVYAHNGYNEYTIAFFRQMIVEGVFPDHISFISVFSACSHGGFLSTGYEYFLSMVSDYGLTPCFDHFICMIDLLGRAAMLMEAEELIYTMPYVPNAVCWRIVLSACRSVGNERLGEYAADNVMDIEQEDASPYYLLGHTYAANGKFSMFNRLMKQKQRLVNLN